MQDVEGEPKGTESWWVLKLRVKVVWKLLVLAF